jgi:LysR family transcriptional regulator, hydrogen peroxide-inducible genes activator
MPLPIKYKYMVVNFNREILFTNSINSYSLSMDSIGKQAMNLQQLRYARMLAECNSFVEAANKCGVTQPTLSNGIAQLEEELGIRLFARTTRNVRLTEYGLLLLPGIVDLLNAQTALLAKARELTQPGKRVIRIGVSPLVGMELVGLIVEPFRRSNPNVEIVFREMNLIEMLRLLEIAQLEFVFGPVDLDPEKRTDWNNVRFHEEPLVFVARGPITSIESPVTLKDIAEEMFVMVPDSCGLTKATRAVFRRHRLKLREYAGAAMSYRVLQEWAYLGIGAAILPRSKITDGTGADILFRKGQKSRVTISYQACWQNKSDVAPEVNSLGKFLKDVAPSIMSGLKVGNTLS